MALRENRHSFPCRIVVVIRGTYNLSGISHSPGMSEIPRLQVKRVIQSTVPGNSPVFRTLQLAGR